MLSKVPDEDTLAAFEELDNGGGFTFSGSTEDLFKELLEFDYVRKDDDNTVGIKNC